ncbi:jg13588 [Pararge aegeria aegeria]|uniref:Jg13588 protein n=1 Tax=Pararge aegeria aegeria TaxID=348720 RepID=A0A8S4QV03_9NEOP|nr:jg13588 [Pararge aegeria aegeria]
MVPPFATKKTGKQITSIQLYLQNGMHSPINRCGSRDSASALRGDVERGAERRHAAPHTQRHRHRRVHVCTWINDTL